MAPKHLFLLLVSFLFGWEACGKVVPRTLDYCGVEVTLTRDAQQKIQGYVDELVRVPRYFNEMVRRAHTYMPFIEEALQEVGVPDDLKYLAIQESALRPDVVSTSQAVGFWQFKVETARDFGLRVNDKVDERMHIYRASEAAARYLKRANQDFDNWLYAVLAYYAGMTGAVQYTDPTNYGSRSITIDGNFHWYVLKAIAHKIAYETEVNQRQRPLVTLEPHSNQGEILIKRLLDEHQVDQEEFFLYNKWIRDERRLPKDELFTYYVPKPAEFYTGHTEDPTKLALQGETPRPGLGPSRPEMVGSMGEFEDNLDEEPEQRPAQPVATMAGAFRALVPEQMPRERYVIFELVHDIHYGEEYYLYTNNIPLPELSELLGVRLSQLMVWNNLLPGQIPEENTLLYLNKPGRAAFHIVRQGETIESIANLHRMSTRKLMRKNRITVDAPSIYIGQKLYLRHKRPREEKIIILRHGLDLEQIVNRPQPRKRPVPAQPSASTDNAPSQDRVSQPNPPRPARPQTQDPVGGQSNTRWVTHEVQPGDTLWKLSQRYGTRVEIIMRSNDLTNDRLSPGQVLKIPARPDRD